MAGEQHSTLNLLSPSDLFQQINLLLEDLNQVIEKGFVKVTDSLLAPSPLLWRGVVFLALRASSA
jgi:hypothetical protein